MRPRRLMGVSGRPLNFTVSAVGVRLTGSFAVLRKVPLAAFGNSRE